MKRRILPLALLVLFACEPSSTVTPLVDEDAAPDSISTPDSQLAILDGTREGGNPGFFWLPPMVRGEPEIDGEFDESLLPFLSVEICEWDGDACVGDPIRTLTSEGEESEQLRISTDEDGTQHYIVNWHTGDDALDPEAIYRISVKAGPVELGYADVDLVQKMREAASIDPEQYAALADGRTLPVKFFANGRAIFGVGGLAAFATNEPTVPLVLVDAEGRQTELLADAETGAFVGGGISLEGFGERVVVRHNDRGIPQAAFYEGGVIYLTDWELVNDRVQVVIWSTDESGVLALSTAVLPEDFNEWFIEASTPAPATVEGLSSQIGGGDFAKLFAQGTYAFGCAALFIQGKPQASSWCAKSGVKFLGSLNDSFLAQNLLDISAILLAGGNPVWTGFAAITIVIDRASPANVYVTQGDGQTGSVGQVLPLPLQVVVTNRFDQTLRNILGTFFVTGGGGLVEGAASARVSTDSNGAAETTWELGNQAGLQTVAFNTISFKRLAVGFSAQATSVATDDLIAYYPLDGGQAIDESGNGWDGTVSGATATLGRDGTSNGALQFDGTDHVSTLLAPTFEQGESFSISAWFNTSTDQPDGMGVLGLEVTDHQELSLQARFEQALGFVRDDGPGRITVQTLSGTTVDDGQWHHAVLVRDATADEIRLYVDEVLVDTQSDGTTTPINGSSAQPFAIGAVNNSSFGMIKQFIGAIDEVKIFGDALSAQDVDDLCDVPSVCDGSGGTSTVYSEDFSTSPDLTRTYTPKTGEFFQWDSVDEIYEIRIIEEDGVEKYAFSSPFNRITTAPFSISVDMFIEQESWGLPHGMIFSDGPTGTAGLVINHTGTSSEFVIADVSPSTSAYRSVPVAEDTWYRITLDYFGDGTADIEIRERATGLVVAQHTGVDFIPGPFDRAAYGARTLNFDGTVAEIHYDNVSVSVGGG